jgi:hypothetical protein
MIYDVRRQEREPQHQERCGLPWAWKALGRGATLHCAGEAELAHLGQKVRDEVERGEGRVADPLRQAPLAQQILKRFAKASGAKPEQCGPWPNGPSLACEDHPSRASA